MRTPVIEQLLALEQHVACLSLWDVRGGLVGRAGGWAQWPMPRPPSTGMTAPVMYAASSEARKRTAAATSSGSAKRPAGMLGQVGLLALLGQRGGHVGLDEARARRRWR